MDVRQKVFSLMQARWLKRLCGMPHPFRNHQQAFLSSCDFLRYGKTPEMIFE